MELFTKKGCKDADGRKQWRRTTCMNGDPKGLDSYKWGTLVVNDQLIEAFSTEEWRTESEHSSDEE